MKFNKLFSVFICAVFFMCSGAFCQGKTEQASAEKTKLTLKKENARFSAVLSGKAICQPEETTYGFCIMTDARLITGISHNGKVLWERSVQGIPDPWITVTSGDFILTVSGKRIITLLNPSGSLVWKMTIDFDIIEKPWAGRDGRIFLKGKNKIACIGINGIQKWEETTPDLSDLPLKEFNDGTLLAVLKETKDGKSQGLRITPFGELIVTITFNGIISTLESCDSGILLCFTDGGTGLCSIEDNSTVNKWAVSGKSGPFSGNLNCLKSKIVITENDSACVLFPNGSGTRFVFLNIHDGTAISVFDSGEINEESGTFAGKVQGENAVFASDNKSAVIYDKNGKLLYSVNLPENPGQRKWNYLCCSSSNYLLLCETSWLMLGWKTIQKLGTGSSYGKHKTYDDFYSLDPEEYTDETNSFSGIPVKFADPARTKLLQEGNYGMQEQFWTSIILSAYNAYFQNSITNAARGTRIQQTLFEKDMKGTELLITQLSYMGTDVFPKQISRLINYEKNNHMLSIMLRAIRNCGYDPDSYILNALDKLLMRIPSSSTIQIIEMCDAVYEICRFMGRPAFNSHGQNILTTLMFPKYSNKVREKARETLLKIGNISTAEPEEKK